eukprot:CAMPEP_0175620258 /NCGR_PEP_ID=MMETSP0096-20121207/67829_1 /TAXON_ID=311494 /ORGANISM="Alexandrium monilatum, Strain CCMP3105" /LENGTH=219 /DNA_ID=CAMNT_0016925495 /DNA_START=309 /DNA_END=965 /DNA_ORIENTATION=+
MEAVMMESVPQITDEVLPLLAPGQPTLPRSSVVRPHHGHRVLRRRCAHGVDRLCRVRVAEEEQLHLATLWYVAVEPGPEVRIIPVVCTNHRCPAAEGVHDEVPVLVHAGHHEGQGRARIPDRPPGDVHAVLAPLEPHGVDRPLLDAISVAVDVPVHALLVLVHRADSSNALAGLLDDWVDETPPPTLPKRHAELLCKRVAQLDPGLPSIIAGSARHRLE